MKRFLILLLVLAAPVSLAQRLASDFEIEEMEQQLEKSPDFLSQLSGHLNLGDLYRARNEPARARANYEKAAAIALEERIRTRRESDMTGYATATAYAGLAQAKLGRGAGTFELFEEAVRYTSDSAKTWNLYASAMSVLGQAAKGAAAARNAVAIARNDLKASPSLHSRLDLAIYEHALATALIKTGDEREAETILRRVIESLQHPAFEPLRREIARNESFEIYSSARGEGPAYLSLLNRSQLRLAKLLELRGDRDGALAVYKSVLDSRTDDPAALAAVARLSSREQQGRWFQAAFDANPFSISLIRSYQHYLGEGDVQETEGTTPGATMRRALEQRRDGKTRAAREALESLLASFPDNATVKRMLAELDADVKVPEFLDSVSRNVQPDGDELRQLVAAVAGDRLAPEDRAALDNLTFRGMASFAKADDGPPGQTILESGTIDGVPFRFAGPTAFAGSFAANTPLHLTYRFLGVTAVDGADAILAEPIGIVVSR